MCHEARYPRRMTREEHVVMAERTIPFPNAGKKTQAQSLPCDQAIAERIRRAVAELQGAMDEAVLAGLVVEPRFDRIGSRFGGDGMLIESVVCKVDVFRGLA